MVIDKDGKILEATEEEVFMEWVKDKDFQKAMDFSEFLMWLKIIGVKITDEQKGIR